MIDDAFADAVAACIDTPFVWGQSVKGEGCDCKGLIVAGLRSIGRPEGDSFYARLANYRADRPVPTNVLMDGMNALFDRADDLVRGRILLLKHCLKPSHLAVVTSEGRATSALPGSTVRERDLAVLFHKFPLHSIWRLREI